MIEAIPVPLPTRSRRLRSAAAERTNFPAAFGFIHRESPTDAVVSLLLTTPSGTATTMMATEALGPALLRGTTVPTATTTTATTMVAAVALFDAKRKK